jgi:hypothetical protein
MRSAFTVPPPSGSNSIYTSFLPPFPTDETGVKFTKYRKQEKYVIWAKGHERHFCFAPILPILLSYYFPFFTSAYSPPFFGKQAYIPTFLHFYLTQSACFGVMLQPKVV